MAQTSTLGWVVKVEIVLPCESGEVDVVGEGCGAGRSGVSASCRGKFVSVYWRKRGRRRRGEKTDDLWHCVAF